MNIVLLYQYKGFGMRYTMRGLVLSGGGSLGSFEVGAIHSLIYSGKSYDMFSGVSVGALNSFYLSQFTDQKQGIDQLIGFWSKISTKDVYEHWNFLMYLNVFWKPSIYSTAPLKRLLTANIDNKKIIAAGKKVFIGAASLTTSKYRVWDETSPNYIDAILASAAFPGFLTPVVIDSECYADGGILNTHNIGSLIKAGCDEIDIISCVPTQRFNDNLTSMNTITAALRSLDLLTDQIAYRDLKVALLWNKLIEMGYKTDKRYIKMNLIRPQLPLEGSALTFDPATIQRLITIGKNSIDQMVELKLE
jgi:NTE family protein